MSSGKTFGTFFKSFARLVSVLSFAALGFGFSGAAHAWGTGPTTTSFGFSGTLNCSGGAFSGTLTPTTTQASETSTVTCSFTTEGGVVQGPGTFRLDISYTGIQSSCTTIDTNTSVRTYSAFCQDGTTVSGTLTWVGDQLSPPEPIPAFCGTNNPCVLNVGSFPTKGNGSVSSKDCSTAFPATDVFADKQVFGFAENYHGSTCTGAVEPQQEHSRYCHSDSFDPSAQPQCIVKVQGVVDVKKGDEFTDNNIVVSIDVQPNTINTSCGGNKDNGVATATVFGSATFDAGSINTASLTLAGAPVQAGSCSLGDANSDGYPDLKCKFTTCPVLGPTLAGTSPNADGTVTIVLQGSLISGKLIQGTDNVNIN